MLLRKNILVLLFSIPALINTILPNNSFLCVKNDNLKYGKGKSKMTNLNKKVIKEKEKISNRDYYTLNNVKRKRRDNYQ